MAGTRAIFFEFSVLGLDGELTGISGLRLSLSPSLGPRESWSSLHVLTMYVLCTESGVATGTILPPALACCGYSRGGVVVTPLPPALACCGYSRLPSPLAQA